MCQQTDTHLTCDSAGRTFTPVERPPESAGPTRAAAADLVMQTRGSRFIKFQEVRIQELAGEVRRLSTCLR